MKITEKLTYIQKNHFSEWLKVRQETENELSANQRPFCVCGRLATGFHENSCKKFREKIWKNTIKKLGHLIPKSL